MNNNKDVLNLAHLVKRLRKDKGLSQKKFAQMSGISNTTIIKIESGEIDHPGIEILKLLAIHLDYTEAELMRIVDASKNSSSSVKKGKLKFLQQPVREIKRYSTVTTPTQEIEVVVEQAQEQNEPQPKAFTSLLINSNISNFEAERKIALKGMRLITLRLERNTTQKELADSLGLDKTMISQYEGEIIKPDYNTISRLADFFGVTVEYLTGESTLELSKTEEIEEPKEIFKEEILVNVLKKNTLRQEYLTIAEEIQDAGIEIEDVRAFIDILKKYKNK